MSGTVMTFWASQLGISGLKADQWPKIFIHRGKEFYLVQISQQNGKVSAALYHDNDESDVMIFDE